MGVSSTEAGAYAFALADEIWLIRYPPPEVLALAGLSLLLAPHSALAKPGLDMRFREDRSSEYRAVSRVYRRLV